MVAMLGAGVEGGWQCRHRGEWLEVRNPSPRDGSAWRQSVKIPLSLLKQCGPMVRLMVRLIVQSQAVTVTAGRRQQIRQWRQYTFLLFLVSAQNSIQNV